MLINTSHAKPGTHPITNCLAPVAKLIRQRPDRCLLALANSSHWIDGCAAALL